MYVIAGPNGSGKTTFATEFLPNYADCPTFINADTIARGLSGFSPDAVALKAGRILLEQIENFFKHYRQPWIRGCYSITREVPHSLLPKRNPVN